MEETNAAPVAAEARSEQAGEACCKKPLIAKIAIFYKAMAVIVPIYVLVMTIAQWTMILRSGMPLTDRNALSQMLVGTLYSVVVGLVVASLFYALAWIIERLSALEPKR